MRFFSAIIPLLVLLSVRPLYAQCSDAGVCAIGGMDTEDRPLHFGLQYGFGISGSPDDLTSHGVTLEAGALVLPGSRVSIRLPWVAVDGPLGTAQGFGDVAIVWDQRILGSLDGEWRVQVGGIFATGAVNAGGLPQTYQQGLGTNDLLFGVTHTRKSWLFAMGYQLSNGRSDNAVTRLARGDDVLARIGYGTAVEDFDLGIEVLTIKRVSESSVQDPDRPAESAFVSVPDSDHLQVNLIGTVSHLLSRRVRLQLLAALPFLQRDVNLDGRKRALTLELGVQYRL
ncbi:MAG: hypothetical protein JXA28_12980 [Bacteroidetes bacterium]|nr:hypothetical protein [Bacteroidota bacterium]